ncbi:hypothetical protein BaRGS_00027154, partial [Batillaria attramentaria]
MDDKSSEAENDKNDFNADVNTPDNSEENVGGEGMNGRRQQQDVDPDSSSGRTEGQQAAAAAERIAVGGNGESQQTTKSAEDGENFGSGTNSSGTEDRQSEEEAPDGSTEGSAQGSPAEGNHTITDSGETRYEDDADGGETGDEDDADGGETGSDSTTKRMSEEEAADGSTEGSAQGLPAEGNHTITHSGETGDEDDADGGETGDEDDADEGETGSDSATDTGRNNNTMHSEAPYETAYKDNIENNANASGDTRGQYVFGPPKAPLVTGHTFGGSQPANVDAYTDHAPVRGTAENDDTRGEVSEPADSTNVKDASEAGESRAEDFARPHTERSDESELEADTSPPAESSGEPCEGSADDKDSEETRAYPSRAAGDGAANGLLHKNVSAEAAGTLEETKGRREHDSDLREPQGCVGRSQHSGVGGSVDPRHAEDERGESSVVSAGVSKFSLGMGGDFSFSGNKWPAFGHVRQDVHNKVKEQNGGAQNQMHENTISGALTAHITSRTTPDPGLGNMRQTQQPERRDQKADKHVESPASSERGAAGGWSGSRDDIEDSTKQEQSAQSASADDHGEASGRFDASDSKPTAAGQTDAHGKVEERKAGAKKQMRESKANAPYTAEPSAGATPGRETGSPSAGSAQRPGRSETDEGEKLDERASRSSALSDMNESSPLHASSFDSPLLSSTPAHGGHSEPAGHRRRALFLGDSGVASGDDPSEPSILKETVEDMEELQQRLREKVTIIQRLEEEREAIKREKEEAVQELRDKDATIAQLREGREETGREKEQAVEELQQQLSEKDVKIQQLQAEREEIEKENENAVEGFRQQLRDKDAFIKQLEEEKEQIKKTEEKLEKELSVNTNATAQFARMYTAEKVKTETIDALREELSEKTDSLADLRQRFSAEKAKTGALDQVSELEKTLQERTEAFEAEKEELTNQIENLQSKLDNAEGEVESYKAETTRQADVISQLTEEKAGLEEERNAMQMSAQQAMESEEQHKDQLNHVLLERDSIETQKRVIEEYAVNLSQQLAPLQAQNAQLHALYVEKERELSATTARKDARIEELTGQVLEMQQVVIPLEAAKQKATLEAEAATARARELEQIVQALRVELNTAEASVRQAHLLEEKLREEVTQRDDLARRCMQEKEQALRQVRKLKEEVARFRRMGGKQSEVVITDIQSLKQTMKVLIVSSALVLLCLTHVTKATDDLDGVTDDGDVDLEFGDDVCVEVSRSGWRVTIAVKLSGTTLFSKTIHP